MQGNMQEGVRGKWVTQRRVTQRRMMIVMAAGLSVGLAVIASTVAAVSSQGTDMVHVAAALLLLVTVGGVLGVMVLPGRGSLQDE